MLRAVNKRFSARSRSGRRKTFRPRARCRWWSARQRRSVAVSPDYPELGRVQWVVEYRRELATEDMPRKPVAGKALRRIGHWGVRYRTMMMSHLVNADGRQTVLQDGAQAEGRRQAERAARYGRRREDGSPKGQDLARSWPGLGSRQPVRRSRARSGGGCIGQKKAGHQDPLSLDNHYI